MKAKTYEDYLKVESYKHTAEVLINHPEARESYKMLLIHYYHDVYGMTLDEAFRSDEVINFQTIGRMARRLKAVNPKLQGENISKKQEMTDICKQIALDIPVVVEVI